MLMSEHFEPKLVKIVRIELEFSSFKSGHIKETPCIHIGPFYKKIYCIDIGTPWVTYIGPIFVVDWVQKFVK